MFNLADLVVLPSVGFFTGRAGSLVELSHWWDWLMGEAGTLVGLALWWGFLTGGAGTLVGLAHWWDWLTGGAFFWWVCFGLDNILITIPGLFLYIVFSMAAVVL